MLGTTTLPFCAFLPPDLHPATPTIATIWPCGKATRIGIGFGFRLDTRRGVIQTRHVAGGSNVGNWQDLTDPATMQVTEFAVTRIADSVSRIPCSKPCPSGDTSCSY